MLSILLAISGTAWAGTAALFLQPSPPQVLLNEIIEFRAVAGHHFSAEAPQRCGSGVLIEKTVRAVTCQFQKSGATTATLNVCDDKKTYCKLNEVSIRVLEQLSSEKRLEPTRSVVAWDLQKDLAPGFVEGSPEEIRLQAAAKKQPVFLMISTEWCPPCNETKEYLFNTAGFKEASANWFKVYVNGDSLTAQNWEKVVPYRAFPTMVMLNEKLQEIGRFDGELREGDFVAWARQQQSFYPTSLSQIKSKTARTPEESRRLLSWAISTDQHALVSEIRSVSVWDEEMTLKLALYDLSQLDKDISSDDKKKAEVAREQKRKLLLDLLAKTVEKDDFEDFLSELCDLDLEKCRSFVSKLPGRLELVKGWKSLNANERASTLGEMALTQSEIYQALGDKKKAKMVAQFCANQFATQTRGSKLKTARAANQARVRCLEKAGRVKEAEALVRKLISAYPEEPTFLIRMARLKRAEKKPLEAYEWVQKAERHAYGYNWFSAVFLKADLEVELKRRDEALKTLSAALAQVDLPQEKELRNHGLVHRIRELEARVRGSK